MKVIKWIWQLPQNIVGLVATALFRGKYSKEDQVYYTSSSIGVSLGQYIIVKRYCRNDTIRHEKGHQKQSLILGPLYLIIIGLPSACGNIIDRVFHKKWSRQKRLDWYYSLPWEAWADKLGGVIKHW